MDFVHAAWKHLTNSPQWASLVADGYIGQDTTYPDGWAFRSDTYGNPFRNLEGTQTGAVCLYSYDSWAVPTRFHSSIFPRLHLAIFSDEARGVDGNPTHYKADDRVRYIYQTLNPLFHDSSNTIHAFDTMPIVSTVAGGSFSLSEVDQSDGVMRGDAVYDLHLL